MTRKTGLRGRGVAARKGRGSAAQKQPKTERVDVGEPPIEVVLRRRSGARRLSLSVSMIDGRARLTAPEYCGAPEITEFLSRHEEWLRETACRAERTPIDDGLPILYRGARLVVASRTDIRGIAPDFDAKRLYVGPGRAPVGRRIVAHLREEARVRLIARSQVHAAALGVAFTSISIRDTRSRWGSCSSTGALSYCWRLIMAPDDVLDYVAAHEVAHLREMNHSPRFWAQVARVRPDWRAQRDWLKIHGAELHRFRPNDEDEAGSAAA